MGKSIVEWKNKNIGQKVDLDNQSYDCVDVAKSWAEYLTDKPWKVSFCWGNAKDIWYNCPSTYWSRIGRGGGVKVGDLICMSGAIGGGYGHIALVIAVAGNNVTVAQQNTFTQQAIYTGIYDANASFVQGYLRPKVSFSTGAAPATLQSNQRKVGADVLNYRQGPGTQHGLLVNSSNPDGQFSPGEVLDFKGFVHGQSVEGNDVWFVGLYSGGYIWSGGFTDKGTHDLANLTPSKLAGNQRQVGGDAMNWRSDPRVEPNNVIRVIDPGKTLTMTGYIQGMLVDGNNVWFQYKEGNSVGYVWSGGFADSGTHDLAKIMIDVTPPVPAPIPQPTPLPTPAPTGYKFEKDLAIVTEVVPAGLGGFEYDRFPKSPDTVVIHDFGTEGRDTISSTLSWFQRKDGTSAHFVVSRNRIVQMVALKDRAYHAGPNGNDFIGIETDPAQDPETVASVRSLVKALDIFYDKKLRHIKHTDVKGAQTLCGDDINLADYDLAEPAPQLPTDIEARLTKLEQSNNKVVEFLHKLFRDF